ncbi:Holliday junction resolvase RuvX [Hyphomicrobiales bacterium]|jgi:putative Holliday junction resolvase|nr:Holliday junction resolvase RuvX [Rhodobiaceae bacterium]MBT5641067.1 Holliday junction resolvase RuvX [Rhodobiaceae bacterium]MBT6223141.1 Holliday junction resolvase RuvX [Rhodobiaceae bacterium]MDB4128229.1 Holliday junction resolvase RuvX [Hyphomicrobiales bacterium]MDC3272809.1 Holliday junction resolvase RuvX [Hyphomicrobiales bacterium]|tara:strand:- start:1247 stop:1720 length:474 start_codon:yes stop_codon:yes gene_type:complete
MIIESIEEAKIHLKPHNRVIGLDLGSKTIGVALSDQSMTIASPLKVIKRTKFSQNLIELQEIINKFNICGIILGWPLNMNSTEGPRTQATRAFARNLEKSIALPIIFWDERLSTVAAEKVLIEADVSRKRRQLLIDKMAATYILQGALDRLNYFQRK